MIVAITKIIVATANADHLAGKAAPTDVMRAQLKCRIDVPKSA
jgi:hypothetical protein